MSNRKSTTLLLSIFLLFNISGRTEGVNTTWTNISPAADSVHELVTHPFDSRIKFAVTKNTLYRTTNGGRFWQPLNLKNVDSVVMNYSGSRLLATTYSKGSQLWTSNNLGSSFTLIGAFPGSRIFTSPDDNILFASGCSAWGFCRSSDGGATWKEFRNFPDGGPFEEYQYNYLVLSVGFPTNNADQLFISGYMMASHAYLEFPFFYFTENGGKNWKKIERKQVYFLKSSNDFYVYGCDGIERLRDRSLERISDQPLTSLINVPDNKNIFWGLNSCDYRAKSIWVSNNTGINWIEKNPFFQLDVSSISAVNSGRILFGTTGGGVYAYSNGKWIRSSTGFIKPVVNIVESSIPSGTLYTITGLEYYNSRFLQKFEPGIGWLDFTNKMNLRSFGDYPESFKEIKIDPFNTRHAVVTIANPTGYFRTMQTYDGGKTWKLLPIPNEQFIHNGVQFNPYKKGEMHFFDRERFLVFKSSDSGVTFKKLSLNCSACPRQQEDLREIIYDPFDSQILYFLSFRKIWKSKDDGLSISELPKPQRYFASIVALPEPNNFLGFTSKAAFQTSDGGLHWKQVANYYTLGSIVNVKALSLDAESLIGIINVNKDEYSRFAFSRDRGKSWSISYPSSLQQSGVLDIQPGSKRNEAIVATDSGLYRVAIN